LEKRRVGSLSVSVVGIGCENFWNKISPETTFAVVRAAIDAGVNFFDTADYQSGGGCEQILGSALKGRRQEVIVATKFKMNEEPSKTGFRLFKRQQRPEYVTRAAEESLRRLGTDYIDLYQVERLGPGVPTADVLGVLDDLVKAGKVREIGCGAGARIPSTDDMFRTGKLPTVGYSDFSGPEIRALAAAVRNGATRIASVQGEYSLLHREAEVSLIPECERTGIAFLPHFPEASVLLFSVQHRDPGQPFPAEYRTGWGFGEKVFTPLALSRVEALAELATSRGRKLHELAM
jgi:aryl-alcohol dehydrogenase-like predicted oxidoreductase